MPQATVHSSLVAEAWLAWHSIHRSMMWLRQMAQLSTTMSQAQRATAFHFFTSNFFLLSLAPSAGADLATGLTAVLPLSPAGAASAIFVEGVEGVQGVSRSSGQVGKDSPLGS